MVAPPGNPPSLRGRTSLAGHPPPAHRSDRRAPQARATRIGTPIMRKGSANPTAKPRTGMLVSRARFSPLRFDRQSHAPARTSAAQRADNATPSVAKLPTPSDSNGPPAIDRNPNGVIGNSPVRSRCDVVRREPTPNPSPKARCMTADPRARRSAPGRGLGRSVSRSIGSTTSLHSTSCLPLTSRTYPEPL